MLREGHVMTGGPAVDHELTGIECRSTSGCVWPALLAGNELVKGCRRTLSSTSRQTSGTRCVTHASLSSVRCRYAAYEVLDQSSRLPSPPSPRSTERTPCPNVSRCGASSPRRLPMPRR